MSRATSRSTGNSADSSAGSRHGDRSRGWEGRCGLALVVTADDFGLGPGTSAGIIRAHLGGPVTAAGLMTVTGDRAAASAALLSRAPRLEVGLHLVLTGPGEAPLAAGRGSGLLGRCGGFLPPHRLLLRALAGRVSRAAVLGEVAAQAERFVRLTGRPPAFVDGHHHAHQFPVIRDALLDAIGARLLPPVTRTTCAPAGSWRRGWRKTLRQDVAHRLGSAAARHFGRGAWSNDGFFGMLSDADWRDPFPWRRDLRHLPAEGVVEWVVHPGLADESWAGRDPYVGGRVAELEALTDPALREAWEPWRGRLATKGRLAVGPVPQADDGTVRGDSE